MRILSVTNEADIPIPAPSASGYTDAFFLRSDVIRQVIGQMQVWPMVSNARQYEPGPLHMDWVLLPACIIPYGPMVIRAYIRLMWWHHFTEARNMPMISSLAGLPLTFSNASRGVKYSPGNGSGVPIPDSEQRLIPAIPSLTLLTFLRTAKFQRMATQAILSSARFVWPDITLLEILNTLL